MLTDAEFVQRTIEARQANDTVWLAYALGTRDNVDESWPKLDRALDDLTIDDLLGGEGEGDECFACHGTGKFEAGADEDRPPLTCGECHGSGREVA